MKTSERITGIRPGVLGIIVSAAVLLTLLPVIIGAAATPPHTRFVPLGLESSADFDSAVYLTWLHEGARGHLPFNDLFLPGKPQPAVISLGWFWIGLVSKALHLSDVLSVELSRIVGAALAVVGLAAVAHYFRGPRGASWARLLLVLTSGGLGAFAVLVLLVRHVPIDALHSLPLDISLEEMTPVRTFLGSPHHLLALAVLPVSLMLFSISLEQRRAWFATVGGALAAVLVATVPYTVPVLILVPIVSAGVLVSLGRIPFRVATRVLFAFLAVLAPGILLQFSGSLGNAVAAARYVQNLHPLPPLNVLVLSFGFLAPLTVLGVLVRRRDVRPRHLVLLAWLVLHTALLFLPVPFARRMVQGILVPYALLAFDAVAWLWFHWVRDSYGRASLGVAALVLAVGSATPFNISLITQYPAQDSRNYHTYIPQALDDALLWIRTNTSSDSPFFGSPETLNLLAANTERPVFAAHPVETPDYRARETAYNSLVQATDGAAVQHFLDQQGMRYGIADNRRDALASGLFAKLPGARIVFHEDPITIISLP